MSEHLPSSNGPKEPETAAKSGERYPSAEELREFERVRDARIGGLYPIEDFARDPEHPTGEEVQAMNDYNRTLPKLYDDLSFEDFFGYPDPREPKNEDQGDQHEPDNRPGA